MKSMFSKNSKIYSYSLYNSTCIESDQQTNLIENVDPSVLSITELTLFSNLICSTYNTKYSEAKSYSLDADICTDKSDC